MKKLAFLELSHVFSNQVKLPYSTGCVWSYCREFEEIQKNISFDIKNWYYVLDGNFDYDKTCRELSECDIIGVSYFVWNTHACDKICEEVKKNNPNCVIIYGGLGTPKHGRCSEFLKERKYVDVIVHNEGEIVFKNLLMAIVNNKPFENIKGITTHKFYTQLEDRITNINELPSPYLNGLFDSLIENKNHDYDWESLIELERGCPYTCAFCEVGDRFWTRVIKQNYNKMIEEINWVSKHKIEYLHLIDNNFGMYKEHKVISDLLISKLKDTGYPNALNITWAKHKKPYLFDIAKDLWKVGLNKSVTIALQSMNNDTLKAVRRANENTNLEEVIGILKEKGIPAYIETILGLPGETLESFKEGLFRLIDDIDYHNYIGIYVMVALPNTPFGDPEYLEKYGVKIKQTSPAFFHHEHPAEKLLEDVNNVVVGSNDMNFEQYIDATMWKWFMISMHFLGWLRVISIKMKKKYGISHRMFYNKLYNWFQVNEETILYDEYKITKNLLHDVFDRKIPWGRKIENVSDIYWEYEEATSIIIAKNKNKFYDQISVFLNDEFLVQEKKILKLQYNKMKDPYKVYDGNLEKWARECVWWGRRAERFFVGETVL